MACFANVNISQGSVATHARCGWIFNIHLTANLPRNLSGNFFISVKIWQKYCHEYVAPLFWPNMFVLSFCTLINSAFLSFFWVCQKSALIAIFNTPSGSISFNSWLRCYCIVYLRDWIINFVNEQITTFVAVYKKNQKTYNIVVHAYTCRLQRHHQETTQFVNV